MRRACVAEPLKMGNRNQPEGRVLYWCGDVSFGSCGLLRPQDPLNGNRFRRFTSYLLALSKCAIGHICCFLYAPERKKTQNVRGKERFSFTKRRVGTKEAQVGWAEERNALWVSWLVLVTSSCPCSYHASLLAGEIHHPASPSGDWLYWRKDGSYRGRREGLFGHAGETTDGIGLFIFPVKHHVVSFHSLPTRIIWGRMGTK